MFKRLGVIALMAGAAGAAFTPVTAFAQNYDGYYGGNRVYAARNYEMRDRDSDRYDRREWIDHERDHRFDYDRRDYDHRDYDRRDHDRRDHERRGHRRYDR
jgi:hypothetical protein